MGKYFSIFGRQFYFNFWPPYLTRMVMPSVTFTECDYSPILPGLKEWNGGLTCELQAPPVIAITSEKEFIKHFGKTQVFSVPLGASLDDPTPPLFAKRVEDTPWSVEAHSMSDGNNCLGLFATHEDALAKVKAYYDLTTARFALNDNDGSIEILPDEKYPHVFFESIGNLGVPSLVNVIHIRNSERPHGN